jgi:hypothetical protein
MAISAIINTGLEKVTQTMLSGMEIAAEQSAKGASFTRGGVAAAKTQVSESVGADVAKEIPGMIKDGFAMATTQLSKSLGPDATELADLVKDGVSGAMKVVSQVPSKLAGIDAGISGKVAGVGIGAAKGVAGKGAAMGEGFSKGMNDLGKIFGEVGSTMGKLAETGINNPLTRGIKGAIVDAPIGAAKGAARGIGDSKMGQLAKSGLSMGKNVAKMAGVNLGIASLLRQSQLFTGVVGMIFQIIGAFIDILLIPFMPLITLSMKMVAKILPPMLKVALFLNRIAQYGADLIEKYYEWIFSWAGKLMSEFWDGLNHLGYLIWDEGIKKAWDWTKNRAKEWLEYFKTLPASFKKSLTEAKDKIVSFFTAIPGAISGILESVGGFVSGIGEKISGAWTTAKEWIDKNIVQKVKDALNWFSNISEDIHSAWNDAVDSVYDWVQTNIVDKIGAFFTTAGDFITNIATTLKNGFVDGFNAIKDFFTSTVPEAIKTAFGFVTTKISAIFDFFATVFAPIGNFVQGVLNKISGYILSILGFMGNIDRFGIGKAVRSTMGIDDKETFNQMIKARKAELASKQENSQIEIIIKQEQDAAQQAIRAADRQANTVMIKQQQSYDLQLADGM